MRRINVVGNTYGKLTVVGEANPRIFKSGRSQRRVLCECECGNRKEVDLGNIKNGITKSCGCIVVGMRKSEITHGKSKTKEYKAWQSMMQRCYNEDSQNFHRYGGRGICVCGRWLDAKNFLADMGESPEGMSLDRIDNNGNYEPSNCEWRTAKQQANNRRNVPKYEFNGKNLTVSEWAEETGIRHSVLKGRLRRGWSIEKALTTKI